MNSPTPLLTCLPLLLAALNAHATGAWTWTDADGTTHYSESPPAHEAATTSRYELTPAPATPSLPSDRIDAINAQAEAIADERIKRQAQRDKAARQAAKQHTGQAPIDLEPQYWYPEPVIVIPPWHHRRHHRGYPHYPHHPHYSHPAPYTSGKTLTQRRNSKALRQQRYPYPYYPHW